MGGARALKGDIPICLAPLPYAGKNGGTWTVPTYQVIGMWTEVKKIQGEIECGRPRRLEKKKKERVRKKHEKES